MEASRAEGGGYLDTSRLSPGEYAGMAAGVVLVLSLWLPWFTTNADNVHSRLGGASGGDGVNAWHVFSTLDILLVLAGTAPFVLSWIIARGHKLTWRPGEITMIVGITAFALIIINGVIFGKPGTVDISFRYGYFVGLLGALLICTGGILRQAEGGRTREAPGTL